MKLKKKKALIKLVNQRDEEIPSERNMNCG